MAAAVSEITVILHTVSGQITRLDNGQAADGVILTFSNGQTVTTGSDGTWRKDGLSGSITVTPIKDGWAFDPQNIQLTQAGINANFKGKGASGAIYTVSGRIIDRRGNGMNNVVLTFNNGFGTTITASDGTWSKTGLWGTLSVIPSETGWVFSPVSQNLSVQANNINFSGQTAVPSVAIYCPMGWLW